MSILKSLFDKWFFKCVSRSFSRVKAKKRKEGGTSPFLLIYSGQSYFDFHTLGYIFENENYVTTSQDYRILALSLNNIFIIHLCHLYVRK